MSKKAFDVSVELDIHAITCPGVWLSPSGKVSLCIFMLDCCAETSQLEPIFPLLCHEKFIFYKTIHTARSLIDLQEVFNDYFLYAELVQWADCNHENGCVLANFQSSLSELLYPTIADRELISGVDIDLLMDPCKCFPGIIAPKVELSTRTTIQEVIDKCGNSKCACTGHVINPKTIASKRTKSPQRRSICQTYNFCEPCRPCSPCEKKPLVLQIQRKKKKCKCPKVREHSPRKRTKSPRARSPRKCSCSPAKYVCPCHESSDSLWDILNILKTMPNGTNQDLMMNCFCGQDKNVECNLCSKYKKYFKDYLETVSEVPRSTNTQENDLLQPSSTNYSNTPEVITEEQYENVQEILRQQQTNTNNQTSTGSRQQSRTFNSKLTNVTTEPQVRGINQGMSFSSESRGIDKGTSISTVFPSRGTINRDPSIPRNSQMLNREPSTAVEAQTRTVNRETNIPTQSEIEAFIDSSNSPTTKDLSKHRDGRRKSKNKSSENYPNRVDVQKNIDDFPTSSMAEMIHLKVDKILNDQEITLFDDVIHSSVPEKNDKKRLLKSNCQCSCYPVRPCTCQTGNINQNYRSQFYEGLEKFYKTLYKRAREKALVEAKFRKTCKCLYTQHGNNK